MEETHTLIESLLQSVEAYVKTTYELTKLKALESITFTITSFVSRLIVLIIMLLFALFSSIGAALWLGEWLNKVYYGFFIIALFYLFIGVIARVFLIKWIRISVTNMMISLPV